ncbi:NAD(P)H-binding protein [Hymenobacter sp. RP-2-7]|uniref:NAD(P)H-binding protein n=1 Tax=Hymenobacter polaris TaxID=2682546 RepID=A0A7Y0FMC9_9BACT|nr:NAD(P)H-binding protein [Hymenobacter polaris]NML65728.1 NAD(P)H-binding protein [Hymenobacter polaris]
MLVVTGASGHLGRGVLEELLRRAPANQLIASARDPQKLSDLAARGVQVRQGDFADPASLAAAFAGAEQVLVVSPDKLGEEGRQLSENALRAAQAAGARRVLYTSHMGTHPDSPFSDHYAIEQFMAGLGVPYTSLRNGYYAESALSHLGRGLETGEIVAPEDGPVSWTTRADLAAADAAVLAGAGHFDGPTPPLVASESVTLAEVAAMASELLGREVRRVVVTDEQWRRDKLAQGMPGQFVELLLKSYRDMRAGVFAATDPTLGQLLGRRPQTMRDFLAERLQPAGA